MSRDVCSVSIGLYKELSKGKWAITSAGADAYLPLVKAIMSGSPMAFTEKQIEDRKQTFTPRIVVGNRRMLLDDQDIPEGSIAVIPYLDVVIKSNDGCGNMGTEFMAKQIRAAGANPNISAIIIHMDTPGGSGDAVQDPANAINEVKEKKPVIGYSGNGSVGSAGYWIISQCSEVYATYETDMVGSIGTYMIMIDYDAYLTEMYGAKTEAVYASKSTAKNKSSRDFAKGDIKYLVKNELDPFNEQFIKAVKEGRGERVKEDVFDGRMVYATEALSFGLIDGIMSFASVIERANELAGSTASNSNQSEMKTLVFAKDATIDAINAGKEATSEMLAASNTELSESGLMLVKAEEFNTLKGSSDGIQANLNDANETIVSKDQKINSLESEITSVKEALGLSVKEGKTVNAAGEEISISEAAKQVVAERDQYGKASGAIETKPVAGAEIETEEEFVDPSLKVMEETFGKQA